MTLGSVCRAAVCRRVSGRPKVGLIVPVCVEGIGLEAVRGWSRCGYRLVALSNITSANS